MKKLLLALAACTALITGMFASCELADELENLAGPVNKWCVKDFEYTTESNTTTNVRCYFLYSDGNYKAKSTLKEDIAEAVSNKGLTIIAVPTTGKTSELGVNQYAIKTLTQGEATMIGEKSYEMKKSLWTGINVLNPSIGDSATATVPSEFLTTSSYTSITDFENSWKKILAQILIDKLLD